MRKSSLLISVVVSLLVFVACENDDDLVDVDAPVITVNEPVYGEAFEAGEPLHFNVLFEDNNELATFNIDIHNDFDSHAHGRRNLNPFEYEESFELTGKSDDVLEDILIPADATAGPYHLTVEAIDAEGNATTFADGSSVELQIWITNDEMALVHFQDDNGTEVSEYEGVAGEFLQFYGVIEDQSGALEHVTITVGHLKEAGEHDHGGRTFQDDPVYKKEFEVAGETSVLIQDLLSNENIVVTGDHLDELEEGEHLYLIVLAEDEAGNFSRHAIELHFD